MRSVFYSLLSLATLATGLAVDTRASAKATRAANDDWEDDVVPDTIFNGQTVPPITELAMNIDEEISHGNWLVEFFSPTCPHCMRMKPVYQTFYEFYYTSKPITTSQETDKDGLNSFTRWYDFKIAKVDCMAYRDACTAHEINNYPSIVHFKDGKEVTRKVGEQDLKTLSDWTEEILEAIRPGTRVKGGPKLPKVGANSVETGPETEGEAKEKAQEAAKASATAASKTAKATKAARPSAVKPVFTANPSGVSQVLTAETFPEKVTNSGAGWFVKFYAPWCHHCQALAPNWAQVAREMKGKLNIGEVNCDVEKKLCKDAEIKGYPTVLFFQGGQRVEYGGMRGVGDLIEYAKQGVEASQGVQDVDVAEFKKLEEKEEVIFVYFYDHATTSEDFKALERLPLSLIGKAKLVISNDKELAERFKINTWPRLMVSRDGKPSYFGPRTPAEMRDIKKMLTWMKTVWIPIVPEVKSDNARQIMDGKMVVLAILNRENTDEFARSKRELKNAALEWVGKEDQMYQLERQELRDAKQLRIEEAEDKEDERALRAAKGMRIDMKDIKRKPVGFAWVDAVFWERWIRSNFGIDAKEGARVVINDEDNHRYWDTTINGEPIKVSRSAILDTIKEVTKKPPTIKPKSTSGAFMGFFLSISSFLYNHPFLSFGAVVGFIVAVSMLGPGRMRRRTFGSSGSYFQAGEKDGLLGGRGIGKND